MTRDVFPFVDSREGGRVIVGHGGGYSGYTTQTLFDSQRRAGVIVFTNAQDSGPGVMAGQLMRSVGKAVASAIHRPPPAVAWDPAWSRFAGLYRGRGGDQRVVELHERLVLMSPNASTLENVIELEPLDGGRIRHVAESGGGPAGEVLRFVEEDGRVVRMITGDSFVDRIRD